MNADEHLESDLDRGIRHLRIARPARKNAVTLSMFAAMADMVRLANDDDATRTVLVSGAGDTFCAGHDLDAFAEWPQHAEDPVPRFMHALADFGKPLVIAVHGAAVGVGATMLLHADWICCTPDARLRFPFVDLGIGPEAGSSALLPRAVGLQRARRLLLGAEAIDGRRAFDWGLVTELCAPDELDSLALDRARALAAKPPDAIAGAKRLLNAPTHDLSQRIDVEVEFINESLAARAAAD